MQFRGLQSEFFNFLLIVVVIYRAAFTQDIPVTKGLIACSPEQPHLINQAQGIIDVLHPPNLNGSCSWLLVCPPQMVIRIRMLDSFGECHEGELKIFDGELDHSRLLGRFCGVLSRRFLLSSSSGVLILFTSSTLENGNSGFRLYFQHTTPPVRCDRDQISCHHHSNCISSVSVCDGVDDCGDGTDEENCGQSSSFDMPCGQPDIKPALGNERIVGGRDAIPGSWPWQVSLRIWKLEPFGHFCGGAIINPQWLLTAAHCFRRYSKRKYWRVHIGKYHKLIHDATEQIRYVDTIYSHPGFRGLEPWNEARDIALVKLNAPITFTPFVQPICLPKPSLEIPPGTICHVTGWGHARGTGFGLLLKQAAVPVVPRRQCQEWYGPDFRIDGNIICAGFPDGGHGSCNIQQELQTLEHSMEIRTVCMLCVKKQVQDDISSTVRNFDDIKESNYPNNL
ncbi:transmembrane protease serine 9-like [Limulus polyphemus]|uniref:Transmembrane protease serine 9-like n=1 Tax=Limulus polyphemus TaxID=6850 RepID=A0ABM1BAN7_LIMPO|nr:transmembrane protease serine 9-like [Limulus polyphemus]